MKQFKTRGGLLARVYARSKDRFYPLVGTVGACGDEAAATWKETGSEFDGRTRDNDLLGYTPGMSLDDEPDWVPHFMRVWKSTGGDKFTRFVLTRPSPSGLALAIDHIQQAAYEDDRGYSAFSWAHSAEISEPTSQLMTNAQMRGFFANTQGLEGYTKKHGAWVVNFQFDEDDDPAECRWRTIDEEGNTGPEMKFEVMV